MDKKVIAQLVELTRQLVADVQGAPFPGGESHSELYSIWYEHVQKNAQDCFEFLDEHFPDDKKEFTKNLQKMFK